MRLTARSSGPNKVRPPFVLENRGEMSKLFFGIFISVIFMRQDFDIGFEVDTARFDNDVVRMEKA